jgi:hypothetical protein
MLLCILLTATDELFVVYGALMSVDTILICVHKTQQMQEQSCDDGEGLTLANTTTAAE